MSVYLYAMLQLHHLQPKLLAFRQPLQATENHPAADACNLRGVEAPECHEAVVWYIAAWLALLASILAGVHYAARRRTLIRQQFGIAGTPRPAPHPRPFRPCSAPWLFAFHPPLRLACSRMGALRIAVVPSIPLILCLYVCFGLLVLQGMHTPHAQPLRALRASPMCTTADAG